MAVRSAKRVSVYPGTETYDELGDGAADLNTALETYAILRQWLHAPIGTQRAIITIVRQMLDAATAADKERWRKNILALPLRKKPAWRSSGSK